MTLLYPQIYDSRREEGVEAGGIGWALEASKGNQLLGRASGAISQKLVIDCQK
jgi:hypothetical protein